MDPFISERVFPIYYVGSVDHCLYIYLIISVNEDYYISYYDGYQVFDYYGLRLLSAVRMRDLRAIRYLKQASKTWTK